MNLEATSMQVLLSVINEYSALGRQLFPLKHKSKIPFETEWGRKTYTVENLKTFVRRGLNLGWRLGPQDLVIDIDPRHRGAVRAEGLLKTELNLQECPRVWTGGLDAGRHYYAHIPEDVKTRSKHEDYKGVDFKSHGGFVLVPGCIHPESGKMYCRDPLSPDDAPFIPEPAIRFLKYQERDGGWDPDTLMGLAEIKQYLDQIPAARFSDYHEWLKIGMAVHAASGGDPEAEDLWAKWSTSDPEYADAEDAARGKWQSFHDRDSGVTAATLVHAAMAHGDSPHLISAEIAFQDSGFVAAPSVQSFADFFAGLSRREPTHISEVVARAHRFGLDRWDQVRDALKKFYGASLGTIDKVWKRHERVLAAVKKREEEERKAQHLNDSAIKVAEVVLDAGFAGGRHLVHATNQQFYRYLGTHWTALGDNLLKKYIFEAAEQLAEDSPKSKIKASSYFSTSEQVLVAKSAQEEDVFKFQGPLKSVVNTKNAEIWIQENGEVGVKAHSPESYLLTCLDAEYDPEAECPMMDQALQQIFRDNEEPEEMIRHLWEFAGYTIQPAKNIPSWWMWSGRGSNGKTMVAEIIAGLMGNAVLPRPIEALADASNNHANASLVGKLLVLDDDAKTTCKLPESGLKKLAEAKIMEANPKRKDAFNFKACATPLILINGWPMTDDLSHGMLRKAYVMVFNRRFSKTEMDLTLQDRILNNELSGVLNQALEGYQRLRGRGHFHEPEECLAAKREWLREANPIIAFLARKVIATGNGAFVPLSDMYMDYRLWCDVSGGVRYPLAEHRFASAIQQMDYQIDKNNNVLGVQRREG